MQNGFYPTTLIRPAATFSRSGERRTSGVELFKAPGDVHYTPAGSAKLDDQVAAKISEGLKMAGGKRKALSGE